MERFEIHETEGEARFVVRVQPRSGRDAIEGVREGALRVRLTAPPVEGEANEALVRLLASRLNVPKSAVRILSGSRGRMKRIAVRGVTATQVEALAVSEDQRAE
ncbi:MAG TPA: DUF167 domain-containing protein [Candidatus Acidoferrales bacterium]|nr:DUF167 domain-containing protein [Candidatus Acidoferrales bacterium]